MFRIVILRKNSHEDIHVTSLLNRYGIVLDSYHLANDRSEKYFHLSGYEKIYSILGDLFKIWIEIIEKGEGFLALDFADQYLGGLSICTKNEKMELKYGNYIEFNGWEFDIITTAKGNYSDGNFIIDEDFRPLYIDKIELVKYINDTLVLPVKNQIIYEQTIFDPRRM